MNPMTAQAGGCPRSHSGGPVPLSLSPFLGGGSHSVPRNLAPLAIFRIRGCDTDDSEDRQCRPSIPKRQPAAPGTASPLIETRASTPSPPSSALSVVRRSEAYGFAVSLTRDRRVPLSENNQHTGPKGFEIRGGPSVKQLLSLLERNGLTDGDGDNGSDLAVTNQWIFSVDLCTRAARIVKPIEVEITEVDRNRPR
jgi:hypothetical protein